MNRKQFLKNAAVFTAGAGLIQTPFSLFAKNQESIPLCILHTNDQHSRIDPFPMDGSKNQGQGGFSKRAAFIQSIRSVHKNVLLLDSGDIFQGTPYFNKFHGELEIKLMNEMGYDASTLGNHDFDGGLENLAQRISEAKFPFLNSNYICKDSLLVDKISPFKIFTFNHLKVGIFGVGIELAGLVSKNLFQNIVYQDAVVQANKTAQFLKKEKHCDFVICLSHLGYKYNTKKICDIALAHNSSNIDLILGGHTHTFLDEPVEVQNIDEQKVLVNQVGWAGICLGQLEFSFDLSKKIKSTKNSVINIQ